MSKMKRYTGQSVYDAALERLETIYRSFDRVYLSVSFGKDSTVMLHLALDVARRLGKLPVHILYIDLEGQYESTIQHAEELFARDDVVGHWVCLPLNLRNAVSMYQPFWTCWDPAERERWIRPLPGNPYVVSDPDFFPFFRHGMEFEEFIVDYARWFAAGQPAACGVGIRCNESLNRFRTIANLAKERFAGHAWTTQIVPAGPGIFNFYPIYDWVTEDVWTAVGKHGWAYNRIYDVMYMAGISIHDARLCQPYGDDQRRGLDLFHRCEPETWFRVVGRVQGANFGAHYAKSALMGFHRMVKPPGHTWKSYADFLLASLPRYEREWYLAKFKHFFWWWEARRGITLDMVPDEADPALEAARKTPSWRRICRCIITNDKLCRSLSFDQTKHQWEKYLHFREEYGE